MMKTTTDELMEFVSLEKKNYACRNHTIQFQLSTHLISLENNINNILFNCKLNQFFGIAHQTQYKSYIERRLPDSNSLNFLIELILYKLHQTQNHLFKINPRLIRTCMVPASHIRIDYGEKETNDCFIQLYHPSHRITCMFLSQLLSRLRKSLGFMSV